MNVLEEKLQRFIQENNLRCEYLHFDDSCHTVEEAARAAHTTREDFVKNICLIDSKGSLIVAIVKGEDRVSRSKVGKILTIDRPRTANPTDILEKTGYLCGGVPSFGYKAIFLIDSKVMEKEIVYTSGGSDRSLIQISPTELQKANNGQVIQIRK